MFVLIKDLLGLLTKKRFQLSHMDACLEGIYHIIKPAIINLVIFPQDNPNYSMEIHKKLGHFVKIKTNISFQMCTYALK
jgi:hypothetical protein